MMNNKGQTVINKVEVFEPILPEDLGKVFTSPYYTEFSYCQTTKSSSLSNCKRIDKDHYVDTETGEIKEYKHSEAKTKESFKECHKIIPKIIKGYFQGTNNEREIILTYDTPVFDTTSLSDDFKAFLKKFNKRCSNFIYLYGKEPFINGSWYIRCIIKINNEETFKYTDEQIQKIWKKGKVKINLIKDIDKFSCSFDMLRTPEKRARLVYYPSNFHPFGYTRGLNHNKSYIQYKELPKYIEDKELVYQQQYSLDYVNDDGVLLHSFGKLKYEQYKK